MPSSERTRSCAEALRSSGPGYDSAASIVRVKSESSSSRIRDEACTDATEPTLAVTPGRSQGPDVIRLGSLHPVADAHLRHQAEAAPVRVGAEDRTEAGVQADEQP